MLRNYFKIAWRNLAKQKGLSFISVFGSSVGIACFSLCALYALNEFYRMVNGQSEINHKIIQS